MKGLIFGIIMSKNPDSLAERLFEMKLAEIYEKHSWLSYELPLNDFTELFRVVYKNNKPLKPERPAGIELDRDIFLEVLVAFRQSFN